MAIKKVVGLQNLKDFYNELKNVFVLNPKDEGKTFLWTASNNSEGYSKDEVDIKLKNLTINGENNSKNFNDYFLNQTYKFGTTAFNRDQYNFYYLDENNEYRIATDDLITKWSQEGTLADKTFYFNDIASRTLTPTMVINNVLSTVSNSLDLIVGSKMMVPYNWQSNSDGSFALLEKTYPDYFTYYREITDNDTLENVLYNQYKKIDSNTEAKTLGATTKIYTQRPSIDEVDTIVDKKLLNIINTNPNFLSKNDLIAMDLDGNGDKQYRILNKNGNFAKVITQYYLEETPVIEEGAELGTFQDGYTGWMYAGSPLDIYLNTTWYNTLNDTAKSAILEEEIKQGIYTYSSNVGTAKAIYEFESFAGEDYASIKLLDSTTVGNRKVYAMAISDVIEYVGKNKISLIDINKLTLGYPYNRGIVMRSSQPNTLKNLWRLSVNLVPVLSNTSSNTTFARAVFTIDLSKISFTKIN